MPHDPAPAPAPDRHQLRGDLAAVPAAGRLASCAPGCGEHWRQMASLATAARSNKAYCAPRTDQGPQTVGEERQITAAAPAGGGGVMAGGRAASRAGGRLWRSRLTLCDAMMTLLSGPARTSSGGLRPAFRPAAERAQQRQRGGPSCVTVSWSRETPQTSAVSQSTRG